MTPVAQRTASKPEDRPVEDLAGALDAAKVAISRLDAPARRAAETMVKALDDAHRAALVHLVRGLRADPHGKELLFELVDDPAIRLVLLMHQIIRPDPATLASQALAAVRPQLQSHGGDVELDRVEDGTAYIRLSGACNGCSMSAATMRNGVEEALRQRVPGLVGIQVLPSEPGPAFVPLDDIGRRPAEAGGETGPAALAAKGWCQTRPAGAFGPGMVTAVTLTPEDGEDGAETDAIIVNVGGQLAAYVNQCSHLAMPLDDAEIDANAGTLTCQWHGYCYDALSGECRTLPGTQLEQLPLRVEHGIVWVRASRG